MIRLSARTTLYTDTDSSIAIDKAFYGLGKDLEGIFDSPLEQKEAQESCQIRIIQREGLPAEAFRIVSEEKTDCLEITGSDELGLIYGIYYTAEHLLGVDPFMFWGGLPYERKEVIEIQDIHYQSPEVPLHFRGWFINDEDCLTGWDDSLTITRNLWEQIFETLLRNGYNTVIPGTGTSPGDPQLDIASSMGLWVAQHHAEPLGAPMFHDIYPEITARLPEEKGKFEKLYREAIKQSRHRKTLWTLGFRGQGDRPFFEDDPRYDSPDKRGRLIGEMIQFQKQLVTEMTDGPQVFLHYIYSESGELYRSGDLELPEEVIPVYSDNGFGGMRVRRELCGRELNIPALPKGEAPKAGLGVYYHVSFHDLEISNKLVPLVHPEVMKENLKTFAESSKFRFFILNVSNIRPHLFSIGLMRKLWERSSEMSWSESIDCFINEWTKRYFPGAEDQGSEILKAYFDAPFQYHSQFPDARAGEQVYHHGLRRIIQSLIRGEDLRGWFRYIPEDFASPEDCLRWLLEQSVESIEGWRTLSEKSDTLQKVLPEESGRFFGENLGMHIRYSHLCCEGFIQGLRGALSYLEKNSLQAFRRFYKSRDFMLRALGMLHKGEEGKWKNFYRGDWLTGTRETIRYLETMLSVTRITGENLWVNSSWMIEALGLEQTAISFLPQTNVSNILLAGKLSEREDLQSKSMDLSILRDPNL